MLPQFQVTMLHDADFLSQLYKGLAILRIGHSKIAGDALCFANRLCVGRIYRRKPFRQQGHLCVRRKVGLQLLANGTQSVLFAGRADERHQIVITPKLRDQLDILAQRLRSVLGKPIDNNAEHPGSPRPPQTSRPKNRIFMAISASSAYARTKRLMIS